MEGISPAWPPPTPLAGQTPPLAGRLERALAAALGGWLGASWFRWEFSSFPHAAGLPSRTRGVAPAHPSAPQCIPSSRALGPPRPRPTRLAHLARGAWLASPPAPSRLEQQPARGSSAPQGRPCLEAGGRGPRAGPPPVPPPRARAPAAAPPRPLPLGSPPPRSSGRDRAPRPRGSRPPAPLSQSRARLPRQAGGQGP